MSGALRVRVDPILVKRKRTRWWQRASRLFVALILHKHTFRHTRRALTRSQCLRKAWMPKRRCCAVGRDSSLIFRRILSGEPPSPSLTPAPSTSSSSSSPLYIIIRARLASVGRASPSKDSPLHPAGKFSPGAIFTPTLERCGCAKRRNCVTLSFRTAGRIIVEQIRVSTMRDRLREIAAGKYSFGRD